MSADQIRHDLLLVSPNVTTRSPILSYRSGELVSVVKFIQQRLVQPDFQTIALIDVNVVCEDFVPSGDGGVQCRNFKIAASCDPAFLGKIAAIHRPVSFLPEPKEFR